MENKKVEKLSLILLFLFIASVIISSSQRIYPFFLYGFQYLSVYQSFSKFFDYTEVVSKIYLFFSMIIQIGCIIWLYIEAKSKNTNKWFWTFLALFTGIFAVILWFLWRIHILLQNKEKISENAES